MTMILEETGVRFSAADRVWLTTALLHREHPGRADFSESEIVERGRREGLVEDSSNTFPVHVNQHCVANRRPNPGKHRMLVETEKGRRRLYRDGDACRPGRTGKVVPRADEIPRKYRPLLDWYAQWSRSLSSGARVSNQERTDPLLRLRGSGREVWKHDHADDFVQRLREGWR